MQRFDGDFCQYDVLQCPRTSGFLCNGESHRVGLNGPHGSLPTWDILWSSWSLLLWDNLWLLWIPSNLGYPLILMDPFQLGYSVILTGPFLL